MSYDDDNDEGKKQTTALSIELAPAYQTINRPKHVKIEIGGKYTLDNGGMGTKDVYNGKQLGLTNKQH